MSDDSLTTPKRKDGFEHESPIRAFTDFKVSGGVAIGKGFRPSLSHLSSYLDAMERKEGWAFAQIVLPVNEASDPTIIFRKMPGVRHITVDGVPVPIYMPPGTLAPDLQRDVAAHFTRDEQDAISRALAEPDAVVESADGKTIVEHYSIPTKAETSTPTHYSGRACADIGERLSANAFAILRYCWRVGQKDDPCVEMDKALWYADSEIALLHKLDTIFEPRITDLDDPQGFLEDRICDESDFTKNIARMLWHGYDRRLFQRVKEAIGEHRFHLDCGRGLAI